MGILWVFEIHLFLKNNRRKNFNPLSKIMEYFHCKKANFAFFLNSCLYCLDTIIFKRERQQRCILYKTKRFHYLLHGDTGGYKGGKGVTGGYTGLKGVTDGYRG